MIAAVVALVAVSASPAAAYPGSDLTNKGLAVYKQGSGSSPTQLTVNQYIWNDVVFKNAATGQVYSVTKLWLVVQSDGNLVLYKHPSGGSTQVCWAVNQYQANAPSPKLIYTSTGRAQLWWDNVLKWQSGAYGGSSIDISGSTGQLYIGYQPISPACY
ncbi:hypothetical protein ACFQY4_34585 [Catellatospora bangladeshensis]|uniref:Bulb-type lectin domain-containing protein n=1 Tax=Catellatospora bangladeshensis TaxID=310355 RepID=A0A8J3JSE6_9ACTN|nr:hypothetical protein [Catellatospora bangladeshensis]GIF85823.1 hypothetical protein Cba03nite_71720 [Catellatospora bangladeshensis]